MHARQSQAPARADPPAIVLVHGLVISSAYMVPTALGLAPYRAVLAPDLPGFGQSEDPPRILTVPGLAEALADWMDAVGLHRAVLVGNSLGCQVIVELAARWPTRVAAAVLTAPTMDPSAGPAAQVGRWMRDWFRERPSLLLANLRDYRNAGLRRAYRTFRHALDHDIESRLPGVTAPTLVLHGSRDPIVSQRWVERLTGLLPQGELRIIDGAPHALNYSAPVPTVAEIVGFLERLEAGRSGCPVTSPARHSSSPPDPAVSAIPR